MGQLLDSGTKKKYFLFKVVLVIKNIFRNLQYRKILLAMKAMQDFIDNIEIYADVRD